jgi:cytochrome c oxidase subunit II
MRILIAAVAVVLTAFQGAAFQERRTVRIVAERFAFTPSQIDLAAGEQVELVIRSDDTSHGFKIAGADVDVAIPKRGAGDIRVPVTFETPGRYTFECSRMCGAGHNFMRGEIVVRAARSAPEPR